MKSLIKYFFGLFTMILFVACQNVAQPEEQVNNKVENRNDKDGTSEMVDELETIANQTDNMEIWHLNKIRANAYDQTIAQTTDPAQKIQLLFKASDEWLKAGDYSKAIERIQSILQFVSQNKLQLPPEASKTIQTLLGVSYLRKAEIENCLQNHNAYSCIIPIEKPGQHLNKEGAEAALEIFEEMLVQNPKDDHLKWLYNITQMTLGKYPNQTPKEYLIPPAVFNSKIDFPRFTDKAMELGLAVNDISGSVVMEDFNNDHYLDLLVSSYGLNDQLRYFQNNKNGGFDDLTAAAGIIGLLSGLNMVQADYNNDGYVDVYILRGAWLGKDGHHPNSLLRNNGDGTFSDVTKSVGVYSCFPTQTASWADFNNDGFIDLFVANEHTNSVNAPCLLYQNNGDGTFTEVADSHGLNIKAFIKGCVWGDFNNDGNQDLYLSVINGPNYLMENRGGKQNFSFENVANKAGVSGPVKSFPCWFFDYNQDGWQDLFVSGFDFAQFESAAGEVAKDYLGKKVSAELPALYRNNKDGTFTEVSKEMNVDKVLFTMGCNIGDLNNDGYPDFYAATGTPAFSAVIPNRMFLNDNGQKFLDVTKAGGFGHLQKGHGVAFGDIDLDGDQDVYTVLGGSYDGDNFMNALFVNPWEESNWIKIKLIGTKSNRSAIGAKVSIEVQDKEGNKMTFYNTVNSGGSFGANPLVIEQGLGKYDQVLSLNITWPKNNEIEKYDAKDIRLGDYLEIVEGNPKINKVEVSAITLKGEHAHHH